MSTTSHHNCVYFNCSNNDRKNRDISFFTFPVTDSERLEEWKKNCGNANIVQFDNRELKKKLICEQHFPQKYICINSMRKILTKNAIPYKFTEKNENQEDSKEIKYLAVGQHSKIYTRKRMLSESETDSEQVQPLFIDIHQNKVNDSYNKPKQLTNNNTTNKNNILNEKLPLKYLPQKKEKIYASKTIHRSKKNIKYTVNCRRNIKNSALKLLLMNAIRHRSKFVKTFIKMQLFREKNSKWTKTERDLALSLYFKSPSAYKFMLNDLQFILPSEEVVQDWIKLCYLNPGLNRGLMRRLSIKAKTMTEQEKIVAVVLDEITLKPHLEFDTLHDKIEGYENLENLRKSSNMADTALVFSIRSLLYNWKIPFSYYTSSGSVNSILLQGIVMDVIEQLKTVTFKPQVLICDQGSNKLDMLELLGATKENPVVQIRDQKIFTCFVISNLLKRLRTDFMDIKLQFVVNKMPISWTDITNVYDTDSMSDEQIFCNTVAAVIRSSSTGQTSSATIEHTAQFLEKISCIFEALKCGVLHISINTKSAYNESTVDILHMARHYLRQIEIFENGVIRNDILCIQGLQWAVNSTLQLWDHLKDMGVKYLLTGCLNLSNFSSAVRETVTSLRIKMQDNINVEIQREIRNSEFQDSQNVANNSGMFIDKNEGIITAKNTSKLEQEEAVMLEIKKKVIHNGRATISASSIEYLAGYLVHKVVEKYKCVDCATNLISGYQRLFDTRELLNLSEDYCCDMNEIEYLRRPCHLFVDIVFSLLQVFSEPYTDFKFGDNMSKNVYDFLMTYLLQKGPSWSNLQVPERCTEHMEFVLKLFTKLHISKCVKNESEAYHRDCAKPYKKIRVLQSELL